MQEQQENSMSTDWAILILFIITLPFIVNIWGSFSAPLYGLTAPEMIKELFFVIIIIFLGIGGIFLLNKKMKKEKTKFFFSLLIGMITIAITYNQLTISMALAPIKQDYAKEAFQCFNKDNLIPNKCNGLNHVAIKRDQELKKMQAVQLSKWTAKNFYELDRSSIYIFLPFYKPD